MSAAGTANYPSLTSLRSEHFKLLEAYEKQGESPSIEFLREVMDFQSRAAATGAILENEEDRSDAQALINYWAAVLLSAECEAAPVVLAPFQSERLAAEVSQQHPYPGLGAFEDAQRAVFFGRRQLVTTAIDLLWTNHFAAILGISGSGKSSVAKAGVLPQLKENVLPNSEHWQYASFVPGVNPLRSLAEVIWASEPEQIEGLVKACLADSGALGRVLNSRGTTLLFVDQFEELFTISEEAERDAFLANLAGLFTVKPVRHYLLVTMRSEYDSYVAKNETLQKLFDVSTVHLGPLSAAALRKAIEMPAARSGVRFDPALVEDLVKQVLGQPAGLPLLQFTLMMLWSRRIEGKPIDLALYQELGGSPARILARTGDSTYESLPPEDQRRFQELFLALVLTDGRFEVMRTRQRRAALQKILEVPESADRLIGILEKAGLIRVTRKEISVPGRNSPDDLIEVTHEALLRNWPRLTEWIEERKNEMLNRSLLRLSAEQWQKHQQKTTERKFGIRIGLLNFTLFDYIRDYGDLEETEKQYLSAVQWRRWAVGAVIGIGLTLTVLGATASLWYKGAVSGLEASIEKEARKKAEERTRDLTKQEQEIQTRLHNAQQEFAQQTQKQQEELTNSQQTVTQLQQQNGQLTSDLESVAAATPAIPILEGHMAEPPAPWRLLLDYRVPSRVRPKP